MNVHRFIFTYSGMQFHDSGNFVAYSDYSKLWDKVRELEFAVTFTADVARFTENDLRGEILKSEDLALQNKQLSQEMKQSKCDHDWEDIGNGYIQCTYVDCQKLQMTDGEM